MKRRKTPRIIGRGAPCEWSQMPWVQLVRSTNRPSKKKTNRQKPKKR